MRKALFAFVGIMLVAFSSVWVTEAAPSVEAMRYVSPYPISTQTRGGLNSIAIDWRLVDTLSGTLDHYQLTRLDLSTGQSTVVLNRVLTSQYVDTVNLVRGRTYCYAVIAYNIVGAEIGRSNQDCAIVGKLTLSVPNQVIPPSSQNVPVGITLENGDGLCPAAFNVHLSYDQTLVRPVAQANGQGRITTTPFTHGMAPIVNIDVPGEIKIVTFTTTCIELYGAGLLFDVYFDVLGNSGDISPLDFITGLTSTVIYDEADLATPLDLQLTNGLLTIQVAYQRGDINGDEVVNAADALLALQIASSQYSPTERQSLACDVNGDAVCNAADASVIFCYAGFQDWVDCGLSGRSAEPTATSSDTAQPAELSVGTVAGLQGNRVIVPVDLSNAAEFAGGEFAVSYNAAELTLREVRTRDLNETFHVVSHDAGGLLQIALASSSPINSNNTGLLDLVFDIRNPAQSLVDDVTVGSMRLNDAVGRDFVTSTLQRTTVVTDQTSSLEITLFMPITVR